jgi:hypothetical protein
MTPNLDLKKTYLIPAIVQPHGHGADEGLDSRRRLVVGRAKSTSNIFVVQNLQKMSIMTILVSYSQTRL